MLLLLINTTSEQAEITLYQHDKIIGRHNWRSGPRVGHEVLSALASLLGQNHLTPAGINRVAVCTSANRYYSSLRAGAVVASVLSFAISADLVVLNSSNRSQQLTEALQARPVQVTQLEYRHSIE